MRIFFTTNWLPQPGSHWWSEARTRLSKTPSACALDPGLEALGREGYRLAVAPEAVTIEAPQTTGIFYGIQSLRQLLPVEVEERHPISGVDWRIACLEIIDRPRFPWRGFMLDEGRHFHGNETVRLTLDLMALQKLNVFHWHLTEDQGWRIEIKHIPN